MVWGRLGLPAPPPITPCLCPPRVLTYGTGSWRGYRGTQRGHGGGLQGGLGVPEHPPQVSPGAGQGHREAMGGHAGAAGGTKKGLRDASAPPSLHVPPGVPKGGLGTWRGCRGMRGGGHTEGTWGVLGVLVPPIAPCVCPPASLGVPKSGVGTWRGCRGTRGGLGGLASTLPVTPICGVPPPQCPQQQRGDTERLQGESVGGSRGTRGGAIVTPCVFVSPRVSPVNKRLDEWVTHDRLDLKRVQVPRKEAKTPTKNGLPGSRPGSPERDPVRGQLGDSWGGTTGTQVLGKGGWDVVGRGGGMWGQGVVLGAVPGRGDRPGGTPGRVS